jgi:hypothetical protein
MRVEATGPILSRDAENREVKSWCEQESRDRGKCKLYNIHVTSS